MDCRPPGSSVYGGSPGKNTGVGCHALLQRIFPTQGSSRGLLHCRRILYQLNHQESPNENKSLLSKFNIRKFKLIVILTTANYIISALAILS